MCNRYRVPEEINEIRLPTGVPDDWFDGVSRRYTEVYPKSMVPVVTGEEGFSFEVVRWGFPKWGKKSEVITNARSETVVEKPMFKSSFLYRRCLMPAESFFESVKGKGYAEFKVNDRPFCFAGIWQEFNVEGSSVRCCSMLTCGPNELVGKYHNRMPVILRPEHFDTYLHAPPGQAGDLLELLQPYPPEEMGVIEPGG